MIAFKTIAQAPDEYKEGVVGCPEAMPYMQVQITAEQKGYYETLGYTVMSEDEYSGYLLANADAFDAWNGTSVSTWAVDKNNVDQTISTNDVTVITSERILWDKNSEFDLVTHKFTPKYDGVWNANGTITFVAGLTTNVVKIHIYRNDEIYFTVWSDDHIVGGNKYVAVFSCDCDCYATSEHSFDLRIELLGTDAEAVISGSDEETAWGMSFVARLDGESPT